MEVNVLEGLGYAGISNPDADWLQKGEEIAQSLLLQIRPRTVYKIFPLVKKDQKILLEGSDVVLCGNLAWSVLKDCEQIIVFAATLGIDFDRKLAALQKTDMARAVLVDGMGSACIESVCNEFEEQIKEKMKPLHMTDRFSCGYGDLPLGLQKQIGELLDLPLKLGVHVLDSYMMTPSKSVTALIGLARNPQRALIRGCSHCSFYSQCQIRKEGNHCA